MSLPVSNTINELSKFPLAKDVAQTLDDAIAGLAVGFLIFYLIGKSPSFCAFYVANADRRLPAAGPLALFAFVHDAFRPLPRLASKASITLSFIGALISTASYISTIAVFGSLGAAIKIAGALPDLEASQGQGIGARLAVRLLLSLLMCLYDTDRSDESACSRHFAGHWRSVQDLSREAVGRYPEDTAVWVRRRRRICDGDERIPLSQERCTLSK